MHELHVLLDISAEDFLSYYRGDAQNVIAKTKDGRRVQFPANALRSFLTRSGIQGEFAIRFDANHKLIDVIRVT